MSYGLEDPIQLLSPSNWRSPFHVAYTENIMGREEWDRFKTTVTSQTRWIKLSLASDRSIEYADEFVGFHNIISINLFQTRLLSVKGLENLTNLTALNLSRTNIRYIDRLRTLTCLRTFQVNGTDVSDIRVVENFCQLEVLGISYTTVSDIGPLSKLNNLRMLDARESLVKDITPLQGKKTLQDVDVKHTDIDTTDLVQILPNLMFLNGKKVV